jgi:hypothetical protein
MRPFVWAIMELAEKKPMLRAIGDTNVTWLPSEGSIRRIE